MTLLRSLFVLSTLIGAQISFAQAPANDNCADALEITVENTCVLQSFTSVNATTEAPEIAANPTCGLYQGADVWFVFEAPASGNFRVEISSAINAAQWAIYSGSCGNLTQIACAGNTNRNFNDSALGGQTLYLRSWRLNSSAGTAFDLCVYEIVSPTNDDCAQATPLAVVENCTPLTYSTNFATAQSTSEAPNPTCGFYQGADVWFSFDVPASGSFRIDISSISNQAQWALYTGDCGNLTQITCAGSNDVNFSDPALGNQTLYIRVWRISSQSEGIFFDLCVSETTPPINDNCEDAIELVVGSACEPGSYSNIYATAQLPAIAPNPTCGFYQGGDVWFKFDTPTSGNFRIEIGSPANTANWALYAGECGNFTQVNCGGNGNVNYNDVSLGNQTLYVRAWFMNSASADVTFDLCVYEIATPANDNCENAIVLPVGEFCVEQSFSSQFSTAQPISVAPNPTCGFYQGGDVWFQFQSPSTGNFRIEIDSSSNIAQYAVYSGSCGAFTQLTCAGSTDVNFNNPALGSQTLFIRVWRINSAQSVDFTLCVQEITSPVNDNCENAIALNYSDVCFPTPYNSVYSTAESVATAPAPTCGFYQGGDVWFTINTPPSGEFAILKNNLDGPPTQLAIYTGSCGDFTQVTCSGSNEINFNDPALGNQTLYIRAWAINTAQGALFDVCIINTAVAENNNCADAINLPVTATCEPQIFNNYNATEENGLAPTPSCGFYQGGDVWFTFTVPASGVFQIYLDNLTPGNYAAELYSGNCGSFNQVACSNSFPLSANAPAAANQTAYLRIFRMNNATGGEFELCVVASDCNGDVDGTAFLDDCNTCVGGNTGLSACVEDCTGLLGGTAFIDNCGTCVGGSTELEPCIADCNGEFGGTAFLDNCGFCVGGSTGFEPCAFDCNGDLFGTAFVDNCGDCVGGNTGETECEPDCNGVFNGSAFLDNCDNCVGGNTGQTPCTVDCNGVGNGTAFIDNCGTCVGGNTNLEACEPDCFGVFGGSGFIDDCGNCVTGEIATFNIIAVQLTSTVTPFNLNYGLPNCGWVPATPADQPSPLFVQITTPEEGSSNETGNLCYGPDSEGRSAEGQYATTGNYATTTIEIVGDLNQSAQAQMSSTELGTVNPNVKVENQFEIVFTVSAPGVALVDFDFVGSVTNQPNDFISFTIERLNGQGDVIGTPISLAQIAALNGWTNSGMISIPFPVIDGNSYRVRASGKARGTDADGSVDNNLTFSLSLIQDVPCNNSCGGDLDNNGIINSADLIAFLAQIGCTGECSADLNSDGIVNSSDLISFLAAFGTSCN